jgi:hypothetical protein
LCVPDETRPRPPHYAGSGKAFEEVENVADRDLGPVDVNEHKRDPSGPAVYIDHDPRLRDLTLLVDERSEVTSDYFVARAGPMTTTPLPVRTKTSSTTTLPSGTFVSLIHEIYRRTVVVR